MGAQPSKPAPQSTTGSNRQVELLEKYTLIESPPADDKDQIVLEDVLSLDALAQWEHELEQVRRSHRSVDAGDADAKDPSLKLSRLVLHNNDPVTTFTSRKSLVHDEKIFNLQLKGLGPNGEYPGPRVNQASSGRCWLFATSELDLGDCNDSADRQPM